MKVTLWRKDGIEFVCAFEAFEGPLGDLHVLFEDNQLMELVDLITNALVWKDEHATTTNV